ncbi:MAG TPA: hypothetical protein VI588_01660, partial [Candidatus Gracilibacteria bacterium]|nr:hypothetical protein [Candidatus Gracilibacteria bacterium]
MLLLFSGCQSQNKDAGHIDEMPLDRRVGIIKSLGSIRTESAGTHLLQLDDGSTILLKSLAINLDDERYSSVTVEVRGVITYTKDEKPIMEILNIDVLDQPE